MEARKSRIVIVALVVGGWTAGCGNHAPSIFPVTNQVVETGKTLQFDVKAVDDDGDLLEFGIQGKPAAAVFAQVDNNTARFQWAPITSDAGPTGQGVDYTVTFLVTDGLDKASETVIIRVKLGGSGTGAPVFITPSDYTLDLDRSDQIQFNIEVRDTDSPEVTLRVINKIPGSDFVYTAGDLIASFRWQPSEEQIAERPVWGFRVGALDGENQEVFQDITILLKGGQDKCEGTPPAVLHDALPDQRGSGDYPVQVTVTDDESSIAAVALYWLVDLGDGGSGAFEKKSMIHTGGSSWQENLPNPGLAAGETATVSYYICAIDDDDPGGEACDLRGCAPEEGRYTFTAYPPGSTQCVDDSLEPNDTIEAAAGVVFDAEGECAYEALRICKGTVDWFSLAVPAGKRAGVVIQFEAGNGLLEMDLVDENGTVLAAGQLTSGQVFAMTDVFSVGQTVYARVRGWANDPAIENRYDLYASLAEDIDCSPDGYEPNDTAGQATLVSEESYTGLTSCGDRDWYRIQLHQGDRLEVLTEFAHAEGDLDLWVYDQDTALGAGPFDCGSSLGCSVSGSDDELVVVDSVPEDGTYYVLVGPYGTATNRYDMLLVVDPQGCSDDDNEPDDVPAEATAIWQEGPIADRMICPADQDWYSIFMLAGEVLVLDLTFVHADGDLELKLYGPGVVDAAPSEWIGHQLQASVTSTDDEHIEYAIPAQGTYYVRVYGYAGAGNGYDLHVEMNPP